MKVLKKTFIKSCILLCTLFMSSISALAQGDFIYEIPNLLPEQAIVRYWQDDQYIIYSEDGSDSYFSLVDYSAMTCTSFKCNYLGVHDFEIDGKDVFFCGNDAVQPIFGFFDIPTLFISGTGMNKIGMGGWLGAGNERITNLKKLEMHRVNDGERIYMIGESEYVLPFETRHTHCIVDMKHGTTWNYDFVQEKSATVMYDDVAITDNWVVVVARKNGAHAHYTTAFPKPTFLSNGVLTAYSPVPYYTGGANNGYYTDPDYPLMIEHLYGNFYAIVEYAENNFVDEGAVVSVYDIAPTLSPLYRAFVPQNYSCKPYWRQNDFRYNKNSGRLYLLQNMCNPVNPSPESVICVFDLGYPIGSFPVTSAFFYPSINFFSLDQCDQSLEAIAVGGNPPTYLWHHNFGSNCVQAALLPRTSLPLDNSPNYYSYDPFTGKGDTVSVIGNLENKKIEIICNQ